MLSLEKSQQKYYADYQFGDLFVQLTRAPNQLAKRLAEIPGVARVQTRVVRSVILDVPDMAAARWAGSSAQNANRLAQSLRL